MTKEEKIEALHELLRWRDMPAYPIAAKAAGVCYTDYLTGAHKQGPFNVADDGKPYVYTPTRNRQCSIGWHGECSDPVGETCGCVCHQIAKLLTDDDEDAS